MSGVLSFWAENTNDVAFVLSFEESDVFILQMIC